MTNRLPLEIETGGNVRPGENVYSIHSPRGLPLKYSTGRVRETSGENSFVTTLDLLRGSSGAPVFDARTHKVIGLVANGDVDYELLMEPFCNVFKRCGEHECRGETLTRTSQIPLSVHFKPQK